MSLNPQSPTLAILRVPFFSSIATMLLRQKSTDEEINGRKKNPTSKSMFDYFSPNWQCK